MFYWIYQTSWGKVVMCEACRAFYFFFATSSINSIIQEHECQILFIIWHLNFFWNNIFGVKTVGFCNMRDVKSVIYNVPVSETMSKAIKYHRQRQVHRKCNFISIISFSMIWTSMMNCGTDFLMGHVPRKPVFGVFWQSDTQTSLLSFWNLAHSKSRYNTFP